MSKNPSAARCSRFALISGIGIASGAIAADVAGSDDLVCYAWSAARCDTEAVCEVVEPWELNMPDFVTIDVRRRSITSTSQGDEERRTPIASLARNDGQIVMQGTQEGRAFSWLITEATGEGTLTVSAADQGIVLFTVCTPKENL